MEIEPALPMLQRSFRLVSAVAGYRLLAGKTGIQNQVLSCCVDGCQPRRHCRLRTSRIRLHQIAHQIAGLPQRFCGLRRRLRLRWMKRTENSDETENCYGSKAVIAHDCNSPTNFACADTQRSRRRRPPATAAGDVDAWCDSSRLDG